MEADNCCLETPSGFDAPVGGTTSIIGVMASRGWQKNRGDKAIDHSQWSSSALRDGVSDDRFALLFVL